MYVYSLTESDSIVKKSTPSAVKQRRPSTVSHNSVRETNSIVAHATLNRKTFEQRVEKG